MGVDKAVEVSLALVSDRHPFVTTAAFAPAREAGCRFIGAANPDSGPFRAPQGPRSSGLAADGKLADR